METEQLLKERSSVHGDAKLQFIFSRFFKKEFSEYLNPTRFKNESDYDMALETLDMIAVKLSRILAGQPDFKDHWDDIAGYAKIYSNYLESKNK